MISYKRKLPLSYLKHTDTPLSDMMEYMPKSIGTIWTSSVRLGLLDVFESMSLGENDFVLLPAIAPQGLVLPLQKKKIKYHFYHLRSGFDVDLDSIRSFVLKGCCRVVVFIHYFGKFNPQVYDVKRICEENGVYLFEDFVHGLFGNDDRNLPAGSIGDISFCSLPKFLPVPDGALIFINNSRLQVVLKEKRSLLWRMSVLSGTVSLLLNDRASKCKRRWSYNIINFLSKVHYAVYYRSLCSLKSNHSVSGITLNILRHIDFEDFISGRKKAFALIDKEFHLHQAAFMSPGYPVLAPDSQRQRAVWKKKGVETLSYIKGWQYVPPSSDYVFERTLQLSHYLLPLDTGILSCR